MQSPFSCHFLISFPLFPWSSYSYSFSAPDLFPTSPSLHAPFSPLFLIRLPPLKSPPFLFPIYPFPSIFAPPSSSPSSVPFLPSLHLPFPIHLLFPTLPSYFLSLSIFPLSLDSASASLPSFSITFLLMFISFSYSFHSFPSTLFFNSTYSIPFPSSSLRPSLSFHPFFLTFLSFSSSPPPSLLPLSFYIPFSLDSAPAFFGIILYHVPSNSSLFTTFFPFPLLFLRLLHFDGAFTKSRHGHPVE